MSTLSRLARGVRRALALAGVVAVLVVVGVVLFPATVGSLPLLAGVERSLEGVGSDGLLLGLVGLLALYLLAASRNGAARDGGTDPFERLRTAQPEAATATTAVVGATLDDFVAVGVETGGEEFQRARARLRESTVGAYATAAEVPRERAASVVDAGDWTADPTAGRFLADPPADEWPLTARLRLWLDPATERERRVAATVAAMAALEGEL